MKKGIIMKTCEVKTCGPNILTRNRTNTYTGIHTCIKRRNILAPLKVFR